MVGCVRSLRRVMCNKGKKKEEEEEERKRERERERERKKERDRIREMLVLKAAVVPFQ